MFETLQERLSGILDKLTGRGALSEADVDAAMREVRRALLEADVALEVVRGFIDKVRAKAVGAEVVRSVTPGQMVVKIVHDELVTVLGSEGSVLNLRASPPVPILMEPVGERIFFAGEALGGSLIQTCAGARLSGEAAALQVGQRLK